MNLTKQETIEMREWLSALEERTPQKLMLLFQHPGKKEKVYCTTP